MKRLLPIGFLTLLAASAILVSAPAFAAVDMFLKIEGVDGEAQDATHAGEIDVLAWGWQASQAVADAGTGGSTGGKADVRGLVVTKYVDKATPLLLLQLFQGKSYPMAVLTVRKAGAEPVELLKLELKNVLISSMSTGGSGGEDRLTENIVLNFAEVRMIYTETDSSGKAGGTVEFGWSIEKNAVP